MFKFKKSFLFIIAVLICGVGVLGGTVGVTKADTTASTTGSLIIITSPSGGENWERGEKYTVKWTSSGVNEMAYKLSSKTGHALGGNIIGNTGDWEFQVPSDFPLGAAELFVIGDNEKVLGVLKNGYINIVERNPATPFITVISPSGGAEEWMVGKSYKIKWTSTGVSGIDIMLSSGAELSSSEANSTVVNIAGNHGEYDFYVPANFPLGAAKLYVSDAYRKDSNGNSNIWGMANGYVNIVSANSEDKTCQSICKKIGSRSEGWYDSCTGNLIKWDNCSGAGTSTMCVKEGESLGAVVPDNNKQCCEGLKSYITPEIIGIRGMCFTPDAIQRAIQQKNDFETRAKNIQDAIAREVNQDQAEQTYNKFFKGQKIDSQITQINTSAGKLHQNKLDEILSELKQLRDKIKEQATELKYLRNLTAGVKDLAQSAKDAINNFITYGVDSNTQKLGAGERAAVINSYKSAFDKLPETEAELSDAIKIANGRFPSVTNDKAEKKAKDQFVKIYKRIPDLNDNKDNAAIKVMAYGLRQKAENRNLNSEKVGIKTFKSIYNYTPKTTEDWNAMQAITYSGSAREKDSDNDLLSDKMELQYGTNPNKADTDGDGHKDGAEVLDGYNPKGSGNLK